MNGLFYAIRFRVKFTWDLFCRELLLVGSEDAAAKWAQQVAPSWSSLSDLHGIVHEVGRINSS